MCFENMHWCACARVYVGGSDSQKLCLAVWSHCGATHMRDGGRVE